MKNQNKDMGAQPESHDGKKERVFYENPYDIHTFFEALLIAQKNEKEFLFMDRFLTHMRLDPLQEVASVAFDVLAKDLELMKFENNK